MGCRATLGTRNRDLCIYVHWYGDVNCVTALLRYCRQQGIRSPVNDSYGWGRMCQILGNWLCQSTNPEWRSKDGMHTLGFGVIPFEENDRDNGHYVFDENWEIVDQYGGFERHEYNENEVLEWMRQIDDRMPESERLGDRLFDEPAKVI